MRRLIAILLLSILLLTNLELYQFAKLPILIEHFREHKAGNPQLSFWQFWNIHYSKTFIKDTDYKRDQQLPFQTTETIQVINTTFFILPQFCNFTLLIEPVKQVVFTFYRGFVPEYCSTDIFQPPRFS